MFEPCRPCPHTYTGGLFLHHWPSSVILILASAFSLTDRPKPRPLTGGVFGFCETGYNGSMVNYPDFPLNLQISTSDSVGNDLAQLGTEIGMRKVLRAISRDILPPLERSLKRQLIVSPPPPSRPLAWKSPRQQRYVMWLLVQMAKERGTYPRDISYWRTNRLNDSWQFETALDGSVANILIYNDAKAPEKVYQGRSTGGQYYARFVVGEDQQPFLRQWPLAGPLLDDTGSQVEQGLFDLFEELIAQEFDPRKR